ncbi:MAG: hypothetical protein WCJ01_05320 [Ignavibacteria bacterium]
MTAPAINFHYQHNSFEVATEDSRRLAYLIGEDHLSRLIASHDEPLIIQLRASFAPVYRAFRNSYVKNLISRGEAHGASMRVKDLFTKLREEKIKGWDIAVQNIFRKGTPEYGRLFPTGLSPFYSGIREMKLAMLEAFYKTLLVYPVFAALANEVLLFIDDINLRFNDLKTAQGMEELASLALDKERINLTDELYGNLGLLMNKCKKDRAVLGSYFNFDLLKRKEKDEFEEFPGSVDAGVTKNIIERTFTDKSEILLNNTGTTVLNFSLAVDATSSQNPGLTLEQGTSKTILVTDLGNLNHHFLNVTNLYTMGMGYYSATIIK